MDPLAGFKYKEVIRNEVKLAEIKPSAHYLLLMIPQ